MTQACDFFAVTAPGLEAITAAELAHLPVTQPQVVPGGVTFGATLSHVLHINRSLSVAVRVLLRVGEFKAVHLSELSRRARALPWAQFVHPGQALQVRATCRASKIYHSGAAAQRVHDAIVAAVPPPNVVHSAVAAMAPLAVLVRLEHNTCIVSLDTGGEPLYRRGHKQDVAAAPLRENLAAALLQLCAWQPDEPLLDPMCGSGTFVLEAARISAGLLPGRDRHFACRDWPHSCFYEPALAAISVPSAPHIFASDRDAGAVAATRANLERAGVSAHVTVQQQSLTALQKPAPAGLLICNPPYGTRLGDSRSLRNLYASIGNVLRGPLLGWRLALVTTRAELARATGLRFTAVSAPLPHGGLKIRLYQT